MSTTSAKHHFAIQNIQIINLCWFEPLQNHPGDGSNATEKDPNQSSAALVKFCGYLR